MISFKIKISRASSIHSNCFQLKEQKHVTDTEFFRDKFSKSYQVT